MCEAADGSLKYCWAKGVEEEEEVASETVGTPVPDNTHKNMLSL